VDPALTRDREIVFNAGTHSEAIRMSYQDFAAEAKPKVVPLALTPAQTA
jgi:Ala-tRNA(Pro) deacylase